MTPGDRRRILSRAASIAFSTTPFGVAFGAVSAGAGLSLVETIGFSSVVFTGSAQFAAVAILAEGGAVAAAVSAGLLLNLRSLAFGILLSPDLRGPLWWRALVSQLVIDESTAVATAESEPVARRWGFIAGGLAVFVLWNLSTVLGHVAVGSTGDAITRFGLDATIPAAFLGLLWPRLAEGRQRVVAVAATAIALALVPFVPLGVAVIGSVTGIVLVWRDE